jgi:hypothetical protein
MIGIVYSITGFIQLICLVMTQPLPEWKNATVFEIHSESWSRKLEFSDGMLARQTKMNNMAISVVVLGTEVLDGVPCRKVDFIIPGVKAPEKRPIVQNKLLRAGESPPAEEGAFITEYY